MKSSAPPARAVPNSDEMNDAGKSTGSTEPKTAVCRRCGSTGAVGDDGFCDKCEKALEQACL